MAIQLTARQREILTRVVEEYVASGQPVGSRTLVQRAGIVVSPSTVRGDLAELESLGLLTHKRRRPRMLHDMREQPDGVLMLAPLRVFCRKLAQCLYGDRHRLDLHCFP